MTNDKITLEVDDDDVGILLGILDAAIIDMCEMLDTEGEWPYPMSKAYMEMIVDRLCLYVDQLEQKCPGAIPPANTNSN